MNATAVIRRSGPRILALLLAAGASGCTVAGFNIDPLGEWSDSDELKTRAKYYRDRKGQDENTARRNAEYDFIWEHGRFPR